MKRGIEMAQFCSNCGTALSNGKSFCPNCGTPVSQPGQYTPSCNQPQYAYPQAQSQQPFYASQCPAPGFSNRVNDPEILAAVKKNKKAGAVFGLILIPLPLIGFTVYSMVSDSIELKQGLLYGGIISAVFLLFALISMIKSRASNMYEGVVVNQTQRERADRGQESNSFYTEYITVAETVDGKKKKIVETSRGTVVAYHYLKVGDRFRYHPQFAFPYELYDKSKAPYIACVACGTHNETANDRCKKCGTPLLK